MLKTDKAIKEKINHFEVITKALGGKALMLSTENMMETVIRNACAHATTEKAERNVKQFYRNVTFDWGAESIIGNYFTIILDYVGEHNILLTWIHGLEEAVAFLSLKEKEVEGCIKWLELFFDKKKELTIEKYWIPIESYVYEEE